MKENETIAEKEEAEEVEISVEDDLELIHDPDPTYYYRYGDARFEAQGELPEEACNPGEHKWRSTWVFGKYKCSNCGTTQIVR